MKKITCAFCKGTGKDPFNLLSELATCQVCLGAGKVEIDEPAIKCAFCKGTGVYPCSSRVTCTVCNGKGMVPGKALAKSALNVKAQAPQQIAVFLVFNVAAKGLFQRKRDDQIKFL